MDSALIKALNDSGYQILKVKDSELVAKIVEKLGVTFLYDDLTPEFLLIKNQKALFVKKIMHRGDRFFLNTEQGERIIQVSTALKKCLMLANGQFLNINNSITSKIFDIKDVAGTKTKTYLFGKIKAITVKDLDLYL